MSVRERGREGREGGEGRERRGTLDGALRGSRLSKALAHPHSCSARQHLQRLSATIATAAVSTNDLNPQVQHTDQQGYATNRCR